MENMTCLNCQRIIRGRTDKKFCDDSCRNIYNNRVKASTNNLVRNINNALGRNRRIIAGILGNNDMAITTPDELVMAGFQFRYYTHTAILNKNTFFYCYDHGYHFTEDGDEVLLDRSAHYQKKLT